MRAPRIGPDPSRRPARLTGPRRTLALVAALSVVPLLGWAGAPSATTAGTVRAGAARAAATTGDPPVVAPRMDCAALGRQDLSQVPGAPATIGSATTATAPQGWAACDVKGVVGPQIQFEALLPTGTWRQRYLQTGCGGFCGSLSINVQQAAGCAPLTRGDFVLASHNEGHVGAGGFDGLFGLDPQLRVDYGYRSDHLVALVVKRLITAFYGQPPRWSYYDGCSQGGHQGLTEAQRYPTDFDGILAGAPASIFNELNGVYQAWNALANMDAQGRPILTPDKLPALHAAVLAACDARDGLSDGQIDDPRACSFDPAAVACPAGLDRPDCLTPEQVGVVHKLYSGPRDRRGRLLYPGFQAPGSELAWTGWVVPPAPGATTITQGIALNTWRYLALRENPPASFRLTDVRFDERTLRRLEQLDGIYDAIDPDLTAFRAAGGKLILWHGWADQAIPPFGTIAYYQAVQDRMGGPSAVAEFARLFMLPGMYHCAGGEGPSSFDGLTPLLQWVEQGTAPGRLLASRSVGGQVVRTRPLFPYPQVARYDGSGSTDDAANFVPAPPPVRYDDRIAWLGSFRSGYELSCGWTDGHWVCTRRPRGSIR